MNKIKVWEPKWSTNEVLIGSWHIMPENEVIFTRAKALAGKVYYITGQEIRKHPVQKNGKGRVYCVPFEKLQLIREEQ